MKLKTARLVESFAESKTLALAAEAKRMKAEGRSVINFAVGEPDFNTPKAVVQAAFEAAKKGLTKYTAVPGLPEVRKAVATRLSKDYGFDFSWESVVLSTGGKQAIYHALQAVLNPGDEVLIPAPYWTSFPEMVKIVGGLPVIVQPQGDRLQASDLEKAVTQKTRMIIFNSPSNPAGTVFSRDEVQSFMKSLGSHPIAWLLDDTYYGLVYGEAKWASPLQIDPSFFERSIVVGSSSKSYAMTGWRIGWSISPKPIADAIAKLQGQVTSNPSSLSQAALLQAMKESPLIIEDFRGRFDQRRQFLMKELESFEGLEWMRPDGAFYCFIKLGSMISGSVSEFCEKLLEDQGVCLVPGEAFGAPEYARLSYALSEEEIKEGLARLKSAMG